uniref:Large ribosomal subunit protein eL13 n=1 Tax=Ascaris lumbricoides TaxID=6252 RepID=A0A0M3IGN6_ASCLU
MAPKRNNVIPDGHFHKHWATRVRTWFNQTARKQRRRQNRVTKALSCAPRPSCGLFRPVVRCPTNRHNKKQRLGYGFTLDELEVVGIGMKEARTIGIAVDYRRVNRSCESLQRNVQRLREYKSKLLLFPKKLNAPKKGDSSANELKLAAQARGVILPLRPLAHKEKARVVMPEEVEFDVYKYLRRMRADKRLRGVREKKTREAAEDGGMGSARR